MHGKCLRRTYFKRGFTLVEIVVVLAIIAVLLTLALPRYYHGLQQAKDATLKQDLSAMRDALDKFYGDRGIYPPSLDTLVADRYIRSVPVDPITERVDTWILVAPPSPQTGIYDIRSGAEGATVDGIPYGQL